jgi:CheY-like chemotaxis protein
MDKATQERIFEPFFTTKELGKGTGLGLATVFGIVKQSGGAVVVSSEPGQGATFRLYFPALAEHVAVDSNLASPNREAGGETLLVVEDEEQVRAVVLKVLRRAGYRVLDADSGPQALATASEYSGPIDLLVTDVVMPKMSGPELAGKLTQVRPGLRVLFMSGYTDDAALKHGILQAELAFIQKPLTPDVLLRKVREVLETEQVAVGLPA